MITGNAPPATCTPNPRLRSKPHALHHAQPRSGPPSPSIRPILRENRKLVESIERRAFLRGTLSLGALTMLTGCDVTNKDATQSVLRAMSAWNDRVQAFLFSPTRLAREYPASKVMNPPRWNAFYGRDMVQGRRSRHLEARAGRHDRRQAPLERSRDIYALPEVTQRTRHVCVEGWDYIGEWTGVPLACSWSGSAPT